MVLDLAQGDTMVVSEQAGLREALARFLQRECRALVILLFKEQIDNLEMWKHLRLEGSAVAQLPVLSAGCNLQIQLRQLIVGRNARRFSLAKSDDLDGGIRLPRFVKQPASFSRI